jgi:hypothetical protein
MRVSTDLHRFVSVCTVLSCNRIIVKDSMDLYRFGRNPGTKLAQEDVSEQVRKKEWGVRSCRLY